MSEENKHIKAFIGLDGQYIEANLEMTYRPIAPPDPEQIKRFNDAMKQARQRIEMVSTPMPENLVEPTGVVVVEGSVAMNEEEALGKLAYEAFLVAWDRSQLIIVPRSLWRDMPENEREAWIAAAKAVAEQVLREVQAGAEVSE